MSRSLRIASLTLLLLATFALGACGGSNDVDKKNAYVRELNTAQSNFKADADELTRRAVPRAPAGKVRFVERFGTAIDQVVAKLRGIKVPGEVRAEHQQLINVMTGFGGDIRQTALAMGAGDARRIGAAQRTFKTAQDAAGVRINAAIAAINSKLAGT